MKFILCIYFWAQKLKLFIFFIAFVIMLRFALVSLQIFVSDRG